MVIRCSAERCMRGSFQDGHDPLKLCTAPVPYSTLQITGCPSKARPAGNREGNTPMTASAARRDLSCQLNSARGPRIHSKMAATAARGREAATEDSIADQDVALPNPQGTVSLTHMMTPSPASTVSLIGRSVEGLLMTPMSDPLSCLDVCDSEAYICPLTPTDFPSMMTAFSNLLSRGLAQYAAQITSSIHADLQHLGTRIELIEKKADQSVARILQNSARIQDVHNQLETALSKINDLEHRSRWYNFRIRGIPKSVKEVQPAVRALIKDLIPDIPEHHLEQDRAHRALQPPRSDGLPRDIIVKPHFYSVKEEVMRRSVAKVLQQKYISFPWSFPIHLNFSYRNKGFSFSLFMDGECLFHHLA